MENIAAQRSGSADNVAQVWADIQHDIQERGPFAALLAQFRNEATAALAGLATVDATDSKEIARLQNDVQRFISTMEIVHAFKNAAGADEANFDADHSLSDDDDDYQPQLEDN